MVGNYVPPPDDTPLKTSIFKEAVSLIVALLVGGLAGLAFLIWAFKDILFNN